MPEAAAVAHDMAVYFLCGCTGDGGGGGSGGTLNFLERAAAKYGGVTAPLSPRSVQRVASDVGMAADAQLVTAYNLLDNMGHFSIQCFLNLLIRRRGGFASSTMAAAAVVDENGSPKKTRLGGFKTLPFILANEVCDRFATAGFNANMITYLTQQLHLPLVEASNLLTNFTGTAAFTPVLGAIAADSFAGRFWTIAAAGVLYQLGMLGLVVSALVPALRPASCACAAAPCQHADGGQLAVLYLSLLCTALGFLDRAAIVKAGDIAVSGEPNLWRVSTVHRVEELKSIVRMLPLGRPASRPSPPGRTTSPSPSSRRGTMDRHLTPRFQIPPATMIIFTTLTMLVSLAIYDRVFVPVARRYTGRQSGITYFQRMGAALGVLAGALVEAKRRAAAAEHGLLDSPGAIVPVSVFWLVPQYALHGVSDALATVGNMEFLYDQSPDSMRSSAAALFWVAGSLGNYLGTVLVTVVQSASRGEWLQDNINKGRLDYYYWLVTFLLVLNLAYYFFCFHFYTLKSFEMDGGDEVQRRQDVARSAEGET
uniref:Uncharacterized protein n=1 Tax=Oryza punctata TaxID=4537 RepID=A0A0E0L2H9_ORYPU